jgi:cytochrome c-type biogenesis protein
VPLDLPGVFAAGLLTFLSPCVLPLVPIYLGLLAGASVAEVRRGGGRARLVATSLAFSLGLGTVFVALGLAASSAAALLAEHRAPLLAAGGAALVLVGLGQLGVLRLPLLERERRPLLARLRGGGSLAGAFAFGAAFALGWTPCVGPVLGGVLTYAASASATPVRGALLLGTYAAGLAAPLVAAAAVAPRALALLDRVKPHLRTVERVTGALLVLAGALLATDRLGWMVPATAAPAPTAAPTATSSPTASAPVALAAPTPSPNSAEACVPGVAACDLPATEAPEADAELAALAAALARPKGPAVVELVSDRCPVCARMAPIVEAARQRCAGPHLAVELHRVESAEGAALARRHAVRAVPTFLLLDDSGAEVARLVGEQPLDALERAMRELTGGRCARREG